MKNPLVFFVGAAVAAVGVVAAATYERWQDWPTTVAGPPVVVDEYTGMASQPEADAPAPKAETVDEVPSDDTLPEGEAEVVLEEPAPGPEEQVEAAPEVTTTETAEDVDEAPVDEAPLDEAAPEAERLAAVDPQEPEAAAPDDDTAEPEPNVAVQPSFDVVRLEDDGSLIAVGRAAPDATIRLLLDGEVIATTSANEAGEWLIMPGEPLPSGSRELMVEASDGTGAGTRSSEVIALAVPERPGERPVVLSEPAQPPEAEPDEELAAAPEPPIEEEPEPAETAGAPGETEEQDVALAPLPEAEVEADAPATRQPEPPAAELQPEEQAAVTPEPRTEPEREVEQVTEPVDVPLALETVDYNDKGEIVFSGRADPGRTIRVHVDGQLVGEATADADGHWAFAGGGEIAPGRHTLRADLTDATGQVYGRILLPFVRAETREVAALVESRRDAAKEREAAETAAEPEPEASVSADEPEPGPEAPVAAETVAPEPEAEAPMVTEDAAPEPEPAAPMVAEEAAPEPEPEAPVVAEEVAPEPEPEAPVVAEDIAPEPEQEAPVVADVAPEPEAPVVAEEIAPEPEAPMVAEEAAPEPGPEAPVTAEEIVPEPAREAPVAVAETAPQASREPAAPAPAAAEATRLEPVKPDERARVAAVEEPDGHTAGDIVPAEPGHVVIQPGNNLWRISRVIYGRGIEYTVIYQANRDQIRDPDLIYPGQIFVTPGVNPPKEIDPEWREPLNAEELARQDAAE